MLRTLRIRNVVIIEDLTVDFGPGLNLLTGETGAGKSILVDALGLVAGARADRSLVRSGEERAIVEALFEIGEGSGVRDWVVGHGLGKLEDGQLLVQREVRPTGAGRVRVNGSPCTVNLLRELGRQMLELHGQHEQQTLLESERQQVLLDGFGKHGEQLRKVALAHASVKAAAEHLSELRGRAGERAELAQRLQRTIEEIDAVRPRPGEIEKLDRDCRRLKSAGRIAQLVEEVVALSYEGEPSAAGLAAAAGRRARELAELDPGLAELAERVESARVELQDAGAAFRDYRESADFDPDRLEEIESRRVALERLCLRFGADEAGLVERVESAREELRVLEGLEGEIEAAERAAEAATEGYVRAAGALSRARRRAGARLAEKLEAQFAALALLQARLEVGFTPGRGPGIRLADGAELPLGPRGMERVELRLAANPGEPMRPLTQAASGGELSRVMLALHVVGGGAEDSRVVVFDEVDAGIGGAVADAVGARLAQLARRQQVLCVTHLAQVAAYADHHYRVGKRIADGRTKAAIARLSGESRVNELARMLGGRRPTPTSRRHAAELLVAAGRSADPPIRRRA